MNTRTLIITFVWMIMSNIGIFAQEHWDAQERIELNKGVFPKNFSKAIDIIQYDLLGIERGKSHVKVIDNNTLYINLSFSLKNFVQQGDWRIAVKPDFLPSFHWAPHLTPTDRNVIDQHVFRSPALIVADDHQTLILIPDLDIMQKGTPVRWYMDMDASSNTLILGMCNNHVSEHVLFERDQETTYPICKSSCNEHTLPYVGHVCGFGNHLTSLCDTPKAYEGQPGFEVLRTVPGTWDEIRVPLAKMNEHVTVARRSGSDWWVGSLNNGAERNLKLELDFLSEGDYQATIYTDAEDVDRNPNHLDRQVRKVTRKDIIELNLAKDGGALLHIRRL